MIMLALIFCHSEFSCHSEQGEESTRYCGGRFFGLWPQNDSKNNLGSLLNKALICGFLLIQLLCLTPASYAAQITVAQDNSGDFSLITQALKEAKSGDIIYVKPGVYKESLNIKKDNITIKGAGFSRTKIVSDNAFAVKLKKIKGFSLTGFFIKTKTKQGHSAVLISASKALITHCVIMSEPDGYGMYCNKGSQIDISNNTLVENQRNGAIRLDSSCKAQIKNNIIVHNSFGIYNKDETGDIKISYNNVWNNGQNYRNAKPNTGNISADPKFIDYKKENYRLSSTSPCIGAGENGINMGAKAKLDFSISAQKTASPSTPIIKSKPDKPKSKPKPKALAPAKLEFSYKLSGINEAGKVKGGDTLNLQVKIKNLGQQSTDKVQLIFD